MASETVDPIDWSHLPPSWAVPPERLVHSINQCTQRDSNVQPHVPHVITAHNNNSYLVIMIIIKPSAIFVCLSWNLYVLKAAVMVEWLWWQTSRVRDFTCLRVRAPHECRFSVRCKVIHHPAFYDANTGLTEFIISIVNLVKMVICPRDDYPTLSKKVLVYYGLNFWIS